MASAPSRYEVEHLHRLMMRASVDASQLDKRVSDEQKGDTLSAELRHWHDAADAIQGAVERARTELLRDGTPRDQVDRVRDRLKELKDRSRRFDIENDLEGCVQHWKALGIEFAQLSGKHRDNLVRLLEGKKSRVDQTTSVLSSARKTSGMLPEKYAKVRGLQDQRDNARARYERLRQQYLEAERDHQNAERQKAQAAQVKEYQEKKAPLPNFAVASGAARKGPVLVRLPDPKAADQTAQHKLPRTQAKPSALGRDAHQPGLHPLPPPARPAQPRPSTTTAKPPAERKKIEAKKADEKKAAAKKDEKKPSGPDTKDARPGQKAQDKKVVVLKPGLPGRAHLRTPSNRPPTLIRPSFRPLSLTHAQQAQQHSAVRMVSGPARISLERIERVAGYPTGVDGIGRGGQSASLYFRAENLPESLSIQGAVSIQLGCATRLEVMPSVQLFSAVAGAPLKGKLSLLLLSSGGQLGTLSPKSARDAAKGAARAGGRQVAGKLGVVGKQLESAIADLLEDAADKIFRRAQNRAPQNKLPPRGTGGSVQGPTAEHHVARVNHALGAILQSAHAVKGASANTQRLLQHLDRDHHHRDSVADRLEQTLSHLATATHRTLTDSIGGELRSHLARMDAILSRLRGQAGQELASGAQEISEILQRMGGIAAGKGGAPHLNEFRRLIDERRGQLHKLGVEARRKSGAEAIKHRGALQQMPSSQILGEKQLATLRRQHPGIDKLLKNASHAQLASELGRLEKTALAALLGKNKPQRRHGLGAGSVAGAFQALGGAHLGGFGGGHRPGALGSLSGIGGGLGQVLEKQLELQVKRTRPHEVGKLLATLHNAPRGTPLNELAKTAEAKQKQMATKHSGKRGPLASQITAAALLEVFKEHPRGRTFASHLAPGGSLRSLCEAAQRGHGLPVGQVAQHFLASRGHSNVFNAVATFNHLIKGGHQPHRWGLGSVGHFVSSAISSVSQTVNNATSAVSKFASATADTVRGGMSSFANTAARFGGDAMDGMRNVVRRGVGAAGNVGKKVLAVARRVAGAVGDAGHRVGDAFHSASISISSRAHGLWNAARESGQNAWGRTKQFGQSAWGHIKNGGQALSDVARGGFTALQTGASWVQHKAGATFDWARRNAGSTVDWAKQRAAGTSHWLGEKVHNGLEWAKKTGVVGAIGTGLKRGVSFMKKAAGYTPLGLAVKAGKWAAGGGLAKVWDKTKNVAGKAWGGIKSAYKATSNFLQSPAGQLLVTGLSLAASFIPGGLIVKAIIGGGIGAIQAISEGKNWKGVLAGAAGGALTGALPFLKIGPLAKMGMGALTGGITTLAQGGSLKDALKGAGGGAVDSFDPGAFKALARLKGLKGKNLSKAEKAFMEGSKFGGPLRGLEKAMANPKTARMISGLERAGSKTVKGGIWVSGKAARVQGVLDKVVGAGDKVHGVLTQVHDLAPGLANILGDNPAGNFVSNVGDWAGKGDEKLSKALEYGHGASDQMTNYRGSLDKGLGFAGLKNPAKAYEKMMARKDLAAGKKGGLEHVARLKLEDHKRKHPELHLAEATGKRTRGVHGETHSPRRRSGGTSADDSPSSKKGKRKTLEQALAKGRGLIKKGQKAQNSLEQASALAKAGAGILGDDSELGKHLLEVSHKADQAHGYLEQGIGLAEEFNKGVDDGTPLQRATYLGGKRKAGGGGHDGTPERLQHGKKPSPHDPQKPGTTPGPARLPAANETGAEKSKRLQHAWNLIGTISRKVQRYETDYKRAHEAIQQHLAKGEGSKASLKLIDLGTECEEISKWIAEARAAARGHDGYLKEISFYEEWHATTKKKLHAAIADTRGLGNGTALEGFGISEKSHPEVFENTRTIFAIRTRVQAFGEALHDHDAAEQVKKILAEAKKARADLQRLKTKYKKDKAATRVLAGGGEQDRLIDESIQKLEAALKGEGKKSAHDKPSPKKPDHGRKKPGDLIKSVEGGLKAIDKYRKKAARAGKKVDAQLGKLEHALGKGIQIGKKVDGGLSKIAGVADQLSKALGEDSELGHFGRQISGAAGAGHEKLHDALNLAGKGKRGLHKGRELFEQGLKIAAGHHEEKLEKMYGKKHANAEHEHGGTHDAELVRHLVKEGKKSVHDVQHGVKDLKHGAKDVGSLWGHLKAHDWKGALGDGKNLIEDGKHLWGEAKGLFGGGKKSPHDPTPGPHRKHHHHHHRKHHEPGPQPAPQHGGGGAAGFSEADIAQVVQGAMQWVTRFGKAVTAAVRDIEKLMSAGKTREAGDRVQAVSMTSEQTRFEVTRAVSTAAKDPGLHKQAQSASKHYLEIRKHFFTFVKGLHGLGGQTTELEGVDSKNYPDLLSLSTGIHSLQVKVDALGEVKHADTPMQGPVGDLKQEASGLRARVSKAQSAHKGDAAALEVVAGLSGKLQQIERHLGAHADKKNSAQGDKDLGIPGGAPRPHRKHKKEHHRRRHRHHGGDPIDDILNGEDGRISVDRGGARGDMDVHDGQDVDPAAADTWIGSGEGVKLFSEVFGAFLPAEGAVVHHHHRGGGSHREPSHGGAGGALHGQLGEGGLDLGGKFGAGGALDAFGLHMAGGVHGQGGKLIPKRATGFFKGLFDHLHGFADRISGWAKLGSKMLGKGMHYAEMGMHGLSAIEQAAARVQGLAGKAEGFLGKMGLGKLAGFAGKIGGAAGWVDKESKLLHGGLKTADKWMGRGKKVAGQVDGAAGKAGGIFDEAEHGRFGSLLNLFKSSKNGDGIDGRLVPEKMRLGSQFDEPRRLDLMTMSRMEGFLGGSFAGVRIHTGPGAAQVTNRFAAEAVTVKDHIFFAPGRFNPGTTEGQRLLAHELTHVMQKGRPNLDVRTAEREALHSEHSFGYANPQMETLNLRQAAADFRLGDGEGLGNASGVHTAKRNRSRGHEVGGKDTLPDGEEFIEQLSNRVYELLMEELEHSFESR